jgi:hypothetical protein
MRKAMTWVGLMLAAGCTVQPSPVPVRGNATILVGEWAGDYTNSETGRNGSIVFSLQAGRDTAFGDIQMIPARFQAQSEERVPDLSRPMPQLLRISFVGCEGNEVTGWLNPYPDPETGEKIFTEFDGVLRGDVLKGTFTSRGALSGRRSSGVWNVKRKSVKR